MAAVRRRSRGHLELELPSIRSHRLRFVSQLLVVGHHLRMGARTVTVNGQRAGRCPTWHSDGACFVCATVSEAEGSPSQSLCFASPDPTRRENQDLTAISEWVASSRHAGIAKCATHRIA